ncbi:MAG: phosphate/phosphite/phosphonate ABC transporter substrate-binding protein [Gemmataceae bacterium]
MKLRKWSAAFTILGMFALVLALSSRLDGEEGRCVRIGLVRSLFRDTSESLMQVIMRPFKSLLETQTGMSGRLISGGDANNLGQRLKEGDVHFGIFHGVEFAWAKAKFPELKPLLIAVNKQPCLRAHLIVRADGSIQDVNGLKGHMVALPNLSREHCWLFLERRCVPADQTPEKFFSRLSRPRDAAYAIDDVIDGAIQAAVIDDADLNAYRKQFPEHFTKVKTLLRSEDFPCAVIAYNPGVLSDSLLDQFRTGLLAAKDNSRGRQMMQLCRITRFEDVPEDFDKTLEAIAKAYPPSSK